METVISLCTTCLKRKVQLSLRKKIQLSLVKIKVSQVTKLGIGAIIRHTSCGCSKFFPAFLNNHALSDVKLKNCSPGLVGMAK